MKRKEVKRKVMPTTYKLWLWFCIVLLIGCSTERNTPATRAYHAATTRYNIYFNAENSYEEIVRERSESFIVDSASLTPFYPPPPVRDSTLQTGPFDGVIAKTEKAIQSHSITVKPQRKTSKASSLAYRKWLQQEEFNPFIKHVWLLRGKAFLQNGEYDEALSVFVGMQRKFNYDPVLVDEVEIWLLRTYTEMGRIYEAERTAYTLMNKTLSVTHEKLFAEHYAFFLVTKGEFQAAIAPLQKTISEQTDNAQMKRLQLLLAQLQSVRPKDSDKMPLHEKKDHYPRLSQGRTLAENASLHREWRLRNRIGFSTSSESVDIGVAPTTLFSADEEGEHLLLLSYTPEAIDKHQLLYVTADFNFSQFKLRKFDISLTIIGGFEALRVETFNSYSEAQQYAELLYGSTYFKDFNVQITPVIISKENFQLIGRGNTLQEYLEFNDYDIARGKKIFKRESIAEPINAIEIIESHRTKPEKVVSLIIPLDSIPAQAITKTDSIPVYQAPKESISPTSRRQQLKERENQRKEKIRQRKRDIKERERQREAAVKQREKEKARQRNMRQ